MTMFVSMIIEGVAYLVLVHVVVVTLLFFTSKQRIFFSPTQHGVQSLLNQQIHRGLFLCVPQEHLQVTNFVEEEIIIITAQSLLSGIDGHKIGTVIEG